MKNRSSYMKWSLACAAVIGMQSATAQEYSFIQHKPTGAKLTSCSMTDDLAVRTVAGSDNTECTHWERVSTGDFFFIKSRETQQHVRPADSTNGSFIEFVPSSWTGNWTQWSYEDRGDGFGHIINRATGKQIFLAGEGEAIGQQPTSWRGDYTRWAFNPVPPIVHPNGKPSLTCSYTPNEGTIIVNDNPVLTANCNSIFVATEPTITATWNGEPVTGTRMFQQNPPSVGFDVRYVFEIDLTSYLDPQSHTFEATATASASEGPTTVTRSVNTERRSTSTPTPRPIIQRCEVDPNAGKDFCLTYESSSSGKVTHVDKPFTASYRFLCLNGQCLTAELNNGIWEKQFDGLSLGDSYSIKTQIQDSTGECGIEETAVFQEGGMCFASSCLPPDEQPPVRPSNVTGTAKNGKAVILDWAMVTDDRGLSHYNIYVNGELWQNTLADEANVSGLEPNTDYTFTVEACDSACNCTEQSAPFSINTGPFTVDVEPPFVPVGLAGEGVSNSEILLTWEPSDDVLGVISRYDVFQDGTQIGSTAETQFSLDGMSPGEEHAYSIRACDDSDNCTMQTSEITVSTIPPSFEHLDWEFNSHNSSDGMTPHNENHVGPEAYTDGPAYLATPESGYTPTKWGFAFDIDGDTVRWEFSRNFDDSHFSGYYDLEMHCSVDNSATYAKVSIPLERVNGSNIPLVGEATIPQVCTDAGDYVYFFRYKHPMPLNNDPASAWIYTAGFTTEGPRVNVNSYDRFVDGSANWTRFRHPVSHDGITAAILDNKQNSDRIRQMDRYTIWVDDKPGNVEVGFNITNACDCVVRNDMIRNAAGATNGQQQFFDGESDGVMSFGDFFSYGQVVQFEFTASGAGASGSQLYNDFSYYTIGAGFGAYGDPRLNSAGKAGTTMWFSDSGSYSKEEYNAIFTQPMATINKEQDVDDFIVGHHLFHGVDPHKANQHIFDDSDVQIGEKVCGNCHFRDGRGSEVIDTPRGPRLAPPTYGVKLLEAIEGREAGFRWDGGVNTVAEQVQNALREDHKINPKHLPEPVLHAITQYTELLTVPNRNPGVYDDPSVVRGDVVFNEIGCASCHTPVQKTRADADPHLRNLTIRPYTDMKTWDLGEGEFRTAPLWGLRHNLDLLRRNNRATLFMHDGGSTSIEDAIARHRGTADNVRQQYNALSGSDKQAVVDFVKSL